jgi:hypothetical protein
MTDSLRETPIHLVAGIVDKVAPFPGEHTHDGCDIKRDINSEVCDGEEDDRIRQVDVLFDPVLARFSSDLLWLSR